MLGGVLEIAARVTTRREEAEDVVVLELSRLDGGALPRWSPGAHIDVLLAPTLERQYSLCGDPDRDEWQIAVLRERAGRGGSALMHQLRPGDEVSVRGPRNHFELVDAASYLFIAGGIGITPLVPMIEQLDRRGQHGWELVYGGRHHASMAFVDRLGHHGSRVTLWPEDQRGLLELDRLLRPPRRDTVVYCCGPEALIAAVEECCAIWPADALHVERFHPRPQRDLTPSSAFEVHLEDSGITVTVPAGQTIVEALEAAGIRVATSCREGTCGTCETEVLEGVPDHRDAYLTPEERASGETMLICCSRSRTPRLVLGL